jgi:hypothetical protein
MEINSNHYAITNDLKKTKDTDKTILFLLTKKILIFQKNKGFELLAHENDDLFINFVEGSIELLTPLHTYKTYALFEKIKKLTKKTEIIKKLPKEFYENIEDKEHQEQLKHFFNVIILFNFIKKTLSKKTPQEIQCFDLLNKLKKINEKGADLFNLLSLQNANTQELINDFLENYNYDKINITQIHETINNEVLFDIHSLFYLFV